MSKKSNGLDNLHVSEKQLREDIDHLIQDVWREWCFNALKIYDDTIYQGIIRGVFRFDPKDVKGYKCFVQKRLIKKEKSGEVLARLIKAGDIDVIKSAYGGPLMVMGSNFIKMHDLKLDQPLVLVYATTKVAISLMSVDDVINEIKKKL